MPPQPPLSLATNRSGRTWVSSSAQTMTFRSAAVQVNGTDFIISPRPSPPSARELGQAFQGMSLGDRRDQAETVTQTAETAALDPIPTRLRPATTTTAHRRPLSFSTTPYLDQHTTSRTQPTQHTTQPPTSPVIPRLRRQGARSISSLVQPITSDSVIPPRQSRQGDTCQPLPSQNRRPSPIDTKANSGPPEPPHINSPLPPRVPHPTSPPLPPTSSKHDSADPPPAVPLTSTAAPLKTHSPRSSLPTPPPAGPSQPLLSARVGTARYAPTATRPVRDAPSVRHPVPIVPVAQPSFNDPLGMCLSFPAYIFADEE